MGIGNASVILSVFDIGGYQSGNVFSVSFKKKKSGCAEWAGKVIPYLEGVLTSQLNNGFFLEKVNSLSSS